MPDHVRAGEIETECPGCGHDSHVGWCECGCLDDRRGRSLADIEHRRSKPFPTLCNVCGQRWPCPEADTDREAGFDA